MKKLSKEYTILKVRLLENYSDLLQIESMEKHSEMGVVGRYKMYFLPEKSEEGVDDRTAFKTAGDTISQQSDGGGRGERVDNNTKMIYENRNRIVRIDERTAFIARIVFTLLITFVVSVGAGLLIAFVV